MRTTLALLSLALVAACSVPDVTFIDDGGTQPTDAAIDVPEGPLTLIVAPATLTVTEGATASVTVRLSVPPPQPTLVNITTSDDTRLSLGTTALLFTSTDWSTPQAVALSGRADADTSDESVTVTFRSTMITEPATVDVTVDDDDGLALAVTPTMLDVAEGTTGTVTVRLTAQPDADVIVDVASSDTGVAAVGPAQLTFTTATWNVDQTVSVTGVQDVDTTPGTAMILFTSPALTNASVTVQVPDDDVLGIATSVSTVSLTEGATGTFAVTLTQQPPGLVTVTVSTANPMIATASPTALAFTTSNWNVAQTVTVTAVGDDDVANGAGAITLAAATLANRTVAVSVTDDDIQAIVATPASVTVTEGATATTAVRLAFRPASDVTVSASSLAPGLATVAPAMLTFGPSNYMVTQNVTVTAPQDPDAAGGATTLRLEAAPLVRDVPVAVDDDDVLGIDLSTATLGLTEGSTATFQVRLTAQPPAATTVSIATSDATAGTASPNSLAFTTANWNVFQTVTVTGVQDVDLAVESVTFTASGPGMPNRTVAAMITDNDSQVVQVANTSVAVTEGATTTVGVTLGFQPAGNVTVTVGSAATAVATVTPASLTFTPANYATAQNVTIAGAADADSANGSTTITLSAPTATSASIAVSVTDDDVLNLDVTPATLTVGEAGTGTLMVRLTAQPAAGTTVTVASSDTAAATVAPASLTFTTANYATYQAVTITGVDDADAANDAVTVTVSSAPLAPRTAMITITDNDVLGITATAPSVTLTEGGSTTFGARLTAMPPGTTVVTISSTDTGAATASPTSLTFTTANWSTNQTVTIAGVQDVDLANENVNFSLTAPGVATMTVGAAVTDNDTQVVQVSSASATVAEGGTTSVGVTLGFQPAANVVVSIASAATAVATVSPASLTFTPGNYASAQNVTIAGAEDANATNNTTTISLTAPSATAASVGVTVNDNDVLGIDVTPTALTVGESTSGSFQVRLTAQPGATTTVASASSDGSAAACAATLSFTTANWNTFQTVSVSGVNDADTANESVSCNLSSAPLAPRAVAVTVIDDDFCGNGTCSGGETCATCAQDCGNCCGNGACDNGETCATCSTDCLSCCGNGVCGAGENCGNCSQDCGACCGNGVCGAGENCGNCPQDCGSCCGDGTCGSGETCGNCPQDCGNCCGNGVCESGEDCFNCAQDCGGCCGDGLCDFTTEDCFSCNLDCGFCDQCGDGLCQHFECCQLDCGWELCKAQ